VIKKIRKLFRLFFGLGCLYCGDIEIEIIGYNNKGKALCLCQECHNKQFGVNK
jgi:hypothetical protein